MARCIAPAPWDDAGAGDQRAAPNPRASSRSRSARVPCGTGLPRSARGHASAMQRDPELSERCRRVSRMREQRASATTRHREVRERGARGGSALRGAAAAPRGASLAAVGARRCRSSRLPGAPRREMRQAASRRRCAAAFRLTRQTRPQAQGGGLPAAARAAPRPPPGSRGGCVRWPSSTTATPSPAPHHPLSSHPPRLQCRRGCPCHPRRSQTLSALLVKTPRAAA
jgi:hypothetical protein